ncbi:ATP-binding protein [Isoptericola sp. b441]|uniref:Oxygen sensor histidine kinase NreB n=1 Tax=Actinotalea lenta TaxID=3064654 RepID=A0ABT9D9N4_9CELL|nr:MULTISPECIES: ATP-binding protein [unclassified Isoptericola]MDO8107613.1 ATP-binding protein [Isoptericola sp. b441]MDO8120727.1 ATP-binding protein [Isoptericola sp. b490]
MPTAEPGGGRHRLTVPVRSRRFWILQATILAIMTLHTLVLASLDGRDLVGIPAPLTSSLMLIPVLYAAMSFGAAGALATAGWATALFALHWLVVHRDPVTSAHLWIELVSMVVLGASGAVVGRQVDAERDARTRTERALRQVAVAEARFHDLFEHQPSPVVVTDADGVVVEANGAALRVLGHAVVGRPLVAVVGQTPHDLLERDVPLPIAGPDGTVRQYMPSTHSLTDRDGRTVTQVLLADVSPEHRRREVQRAFTGRVLEVQEQERLHLSRELHDDPLQQLTYLTRSLDELGSDPLLPSVLVQPVQDGLDVARNASAALRQLIQGLRPPILDDLGLVPALRQLADTVQKRAKISVHVRTVGAVTRAPSDVELAVYRIAQEALTNAAKHSGARSVALDVEFGARLTVSIRDDGRGFSPDRDGTGGLGLIGANERAERIGAQLAVESQLGAGTTIRVSAPLGR